MNEEEILKIVDNFIDGYRQYDTETGETIIPYKYGEGQKFVYKEDFEAIQGLLDLYNKEKEENTFLEKQNEFLSKQYEEMFDDLNNNVVSKDKIKAKIEELDKEEKEALKGTKGQDRYAIKQEYMHKRSGLQSLLEKE